MSNMKCPFCQQRLLQEYNRQRDAVIYHCTHCYFQGDGILWQELIRTRKALDVAVDALNAGKTLADIAGFKMLVAGLEEALEQITATLENKNGNC